MAEVSSSYSVEIDRVSKIEWSELLRGFADSTIYQTWSYGAIRWSERNLSHVVLKGDGKAKGIAQVAIRKLPFLRVGIAYVPWGPMWLARGQTADTATLQQLIRAIEEEYVVRRKLRLRIAPKVIEGDVPGLRQFLKCEGFQAKSKIYHTLMLDLEPPLTELRKSMDQKWRNQLNRAEKNGLQIVEGTSDELYAIFRNLYSEMILRKDFEESVDVEEFGRIQADLDETSKMVVMLCIADNRPVAGLVGSAIGDTGIYLLGATNEAGMKTKGSYLLQWSMIQWLKKRGCRWYDLGGINPERNPGVYHFKAGLRGKDVTHIGQFERCTNPASSVIVRSAEIARRVLDLVKCKFQRGHA